MQSSHLVFCNPPENFNPRMEVAACFIQFQKKFLFMKRQPHKSEGGLWGIPGGKREKNETAHHTVVREVREETGLEYSFNEIEHFKTVFIQYPEIDFIYHMFHRVIDQMPQKILINPKEHSEFCWLALDEALRLPLIRGEDECIELFKSQL